MNINNSRPTGGASSPAPFSFTRLLIKGVWAVSTFMATVDAQGTTATPPDTTSSADIEDPLNGLSPMTLPLAGVFLGASLAVGLSVCYAVKNRLFACQKSPLSEDEIILKTVELPAEYSDEKSDETLRSVVVYENSASFTAGAGIKVKYYPTYLKSVGVDPCSVKELLYMDNPGFHSSELDIKAAITLTEKNLKTARNVTFKAPPGISPAVSVRSLDTISSMSPAGSLNSLGSLNTEATMTAAVSVSSISAAIAMSEKSLKEAEKLEFSYKNMSALMAEKSTIPAVSMSALNVHPNSEGIAAAAALLGESALTGAAIAHLKRCLSVSDFPDFVDVTLLAAPERASSSQCLDANDVTDAPVKSSSAQSVGRLYTAPVRAPLSRSQSVTSLHTAQASPSFSRSQSGNDLNSASYSLSRSQSGNDLNSASYSLSRSQSGNGLNAAITPSLSRSQSVNGLNSATARPNTLSVSQYSLLNSFDFSNLDTPSLARLHAICQEKSPPPGATCEWFGSVELSTQCGEFALCIFAGMFKSGDPNFAHDPDYPKNHPHLFTDFSLCLTVGYDINNWDFITKASAFDFMGQQNPNNKFIVTTQYGGGHHYAVYHDGQDWVSDDQINGHQVLNDPISKFIDVKNSCSTWFQVRNEQDLMALIATQKIQKKYGLEGADKWSESFQSWLTKINSLNAIN